MALERHSYGSRRSGTGGWIWARVTAVLIALGLLALLFALALAGHVSYDAWHLGMAAFGVRAALFFWLAAIVIHAGIGIDNILKDYVRPPLARVFAQAAGVLSLLSLLAFGVLVLVAWR